MISKNAKNRLYKIYRNFYVGPIFLLVGIFLIIYATSFEQIPVSGSIDEKTFTPTGALLVLVSIAALILGLIVLSSWDSRRKYTKSGRSKHVQKLTQTLAEAESAISTMRSEIEYGSRMLANLKTKSSFQKRLSNLTAKEAEAIQFVLQEELKKEGKRGLIRDVVMMFLGVLIAFVVPKIFN